MTVTDTIVQKRVRFSTWLRERGELTLRIAVCILFDAVLFCAWLIAAWICYESANFFESKGLFDEFCANAFKWISSVATLILAILYVIADIIKAFFEIKWVLQQTESIYHGPQKK